MKLFRNTNKFHLCVWGVKQRFVNTFNLFYLFYRIERMKRQAGEK